MEMPQTTACRTSGDDPARFLQELRQLRDGAGLGPAELAARAHYPYDRIRAAEAGPALPDLPVLSAYVRGCGGTTEEWEERWRSLTSAPTLPLLAARPAGSSTAASAGARIGSISPAADTPDPSIILAALDRVAEGMAVGNPAPLRRRRRRSPSPSPSPPGRSTARARAVAPNSTGAEPWETTTTRTAWGTPAASTAWETDQTAAAAPASSRRRRRPTRLGPMPRVRRPARPSGPSASGRQRWTGPALSRTTILAAIAVVICVLVAALAIFA